MATLVEGLVKRRVETAVARVQTTVCSRLPRRRTDKPVSRPQHVVATPTAAP